MYIHRVYTFAYAQSEVRAGRGTSIIAKLSQEYLEARGGIELEATCGRKRSGEPAAEIPSRARDLYHRETVAGISGGAGRNRTADRGFADLGLTTWRPRPKGGLYTKPSRLSEGSKIWSGRRDLNPRLRPWQGRTLPLSYSRSFSHFTALAYLLTIYCPRNGTLVRCLLLHIGHKLDRSARWALMNSSRRSLLALRSQ